MQKKITGTICFLMSIIALVFLISCSKSNINGTYYEYSNEKYDKSSYFILDGNKWSDDDGASGTFKIDGTRIVFYAKLFGSEEEMMDGTISDGVLVIEIFGTTHTYCLEGKKPSGTTPTPLLEKITVTYDANGGTFSEGENKKTEKVDKNSLLTAPASPTRQNYTFAGWSTNKSESGIWKFASDKVAKDITLYAVWTEAKASILSIDGAKIEDSTILLIVENEIDSVSLSNKVVVSSGSTWKLYYDKLGQIEIPTKIATGQTGSLTSGDNTFYIVVTSEDQKEQNLYTLTVHRSYTIDIKYYFQNQLIETKSAKSGYEYEIDYIPSITGYTFNYWKNEKGTKVTSITPFSNESFFADATAKKITFTLNVNGGDELTTTKQEVTYDQMYQLPVPTRTGYTFVGWYTGETAVTDDEGKSLSVCNIDKNTTLKAQWQANTYTLSLQGDDIKGTITGGGTYKYDSKVTLKATPNPGYIFIGWYNSEDELLSLNATYTYIIKQTTTITAKFDYETITLNYIVNGEPYKTETYTLNQHITNLTDYEVQEGEVFIGWFSEKDFFSVFYADLATKETSTRNLTIKDKNAYLYGGTYVGTEGLSFSYVSQGNYYIITKFNNTTATNVVIPSLFHNRQVTSIKENAFSGCSSLMSITIPDSIAGIGTDAFSNCSSLTNVYYEGTIEDWCKISFVDKDSNPMCKASHFYIRNSNNEWEELTSIKIPNTITKINAYQFYGFNNVTTITIPKSITGIGTDAFYACSRLVEVYNLSSLTITKNSITNGYVGWNAMIIHTSLKTPSKLREKDNYLFFLQDTGYSGGYYLIGYKGTDTTIVLPNDIEGHLYKMNSYAFSGCSSLTSITIPDSVTSIAEGAFSGCSSLTSITIPDSVTSIGDFAFRGCSSLTSITIPNSVTEIGHDVFSDCSSLTSITIPDSVTSIGARAFYGCSGLTSITIPDSVTSIGGNTFYGCIGLTSITIPNSVTSIEANVFYGCSGLKEVYYMGNFTEWTKISIDSYNSLLTSTTRYYYSETKPTTSGNYWHYVDGVPTIWVI